MKFQSNSGNNIYLVSDYTKSHINRYVSCTLCTRSISENVNRKCYFTPEAVSFLYFYHKN